MSSEDVREGVKRAAGDVIWKTLGLLILIAAAVIGCWWYTETYQ